MNKDQIKNEGIYKQDVLDLMNEINNTKKEKQLANSYIEMFSFISHELKSPLDSIITLGRALTQGYLGEISEKHINYIERMIKKAEYLRNITKKYLNFACFENSNLNIIKTKINFVNELLKESLEIVNSQIIEKNISIELDLQSDEYFIECDYDLMQVVMVNLISNGIKYGNRNGLLKISIKKMENLEVSVWNEGPGFNENDKNNLFQKFSRLEKKELKKEKGTGIGLYMTWKIIQLHKGKIEANSKENEWACFTFNIPTR